MEHYLNQLHLDGKDPQPVDSSYFNIRGSVLPGTDGASHAALIQNTPEWQAAREYVLKQMLTQGSPPAASISQPQESDDILSQRVFSSDEEDPDWASNRTRVSLSDQADHPGSLEYPLESEKRLQIQRQQTDDNDNANNRMSTFIFYESALNSNQVVKPQAYYIMLIYDALLASETGRMSLPQIYEAIERRYQFKVSTQEWQSSVRHNISHHAGFRETQQDGKTWMYEIVPGFFVEEDSSRNARPVRDEGSGERSIGATPFPTTKANNHNHTTSPQTIYEAGNTIEDTSDTESNDTTLSSDNDMLEQASIFSNAPQGSSRSPPTSLASGDTRSATEELVALLADDEVLKPLYKVAFVDESIGPETFDQNFQRFLRRYSEELRESSREPLYLAAVQLVRSRVPYISNAIRRLHEPNYEQSKGLSQPEIQLLNRARQERVEQYLRQLNLKGKDPQSADVADIVDIEDEELYPDDSIDHMELPNLTKVKAFLIGRTPLQTYEPILRNSFD